ncbi:MAG: hypothetical protein ACK462_09610, partial [Planctomyces sp.]
MQQNPPQPAAVKFIFLTLLLDVIGFGLLIPVAPTIVKNLLDIAPADTAAAAAVPVSLSPASAPRRPGSV